MSEATLPEGFRLLPLFAPEECAEAFSGLLAETPWEDHVFSMFGREVPMPRRIAWYGPLPYAYSGVFHAPRPFTRRLLALQARVEAATGLPFNTVLLNLYRDGQDSMGWHSDDDYDAGGQPAIASLSLGASRRFLLAHKRLKRRAAIELTVGSVLLMEAGTQALWRHSLPRVSGEVGARINLTFRHMAAPGA